MANYVIRFPATATIVSDILAFIAGLVFGRTIMNMFSSIIPDAITNYSNNTFIREILVPALVGNGNGATTEQVLVMIILSAIIVLVIVKLAKRVIDIVALFLLGMIAHNIILLVLGVNIDSESLITFLQNMFSQSQTI